MSSDTSQTDTTDDQQTDPDKQVLTGHDVAEALLEEWRFVLGRLHARFRTGDFSTGARLVAAIADAADAVDHHPDVDLRYPHVDVVLSSHDVGGITRRDLRLAATITDLAGQVGAEPAPHEVQALEWALDTPDPSRIKPFWAAVLGLDPSAGKDDEVLDGDGRSALWFQRSTDSAADAADGADRQCRHRVRRRGRRPRRDVRPALPPRRHRAPGAGREARARRGRGGRHPRQRRLRPGLLGARRRRGQPRLRLHLAGPRRLRHRPARRRRLSPARPPAGGHRRGRARGTAQPAQLRGRAGRWRGGLRGWRSRPRRGLRNRRNCVGGRDGGGSFAQSAQPAPPPDRATGAIA